MANEMMGQSENKEPVTNLSESELDAVSGGTVQMRRKNLTVAIVP